MSGDAVATMDRAAVDALAHERLDWRFKAAPTAAAAAPTIAGLREQRPTLFAGGFAGPLVVLDAAALEHNLTTMARWCARRGVALAPHGKTTMAPQLFARQLELGAWAITVANAAQLRVCRGFGVSRVVLANQLVDPAALRWVGAELDRDERFDLVCWVDSVRGVELMERALMERALTGGRRRVDVVVELGAEAGRTGVRSMAGAVAVAERAAASPALRVVGVGGYEGALSGDLSDAGHAAIDDYLAFLREAAVQLSARGLIEADEVIVTAGGSAFFDQVADALTAPWPGGLRVLPLLRSGAYVTHDDGHYARLSPLGEQPRVSDAPQLRSALRAWAQVTSRPTDELALLTAGKRDLPYDLGLPTVQGVRRENAIVPLDGCEITALNDQHAFLTPATGVEVGDWIALGLSHPCTTFDKWQLLPVVDTDGETVVDLVRTFFG